MSGEDSGLRASSPTESRLPVSFIPSLAGGMGAMGGLAIGMGEGVHIVHHHNDQAARAANQAPILQMQIGDLQNKLTELPTNSSVARLTRGHISQLETEIRQEPHYLTRLKTTEYAVGFGVGGALALGALAIGAVVAFRGYRNRRARRAATKKAVAEEAAIAAFREELETWGDTTES